MLLRINYSIYLIFCIQKILYADTNFDINDILNVNFMPGTLLMIDQNNNKIISSVNQTKLDNATLTVIGNASFIEAFNTMKFHRKMFNEYLCRNFLADQILQELKPAKLNRRIGVTPTPFATTTATATAINSSSTALLNNGKSYRKGRVSITSNVKDSLLSDPGSSNYKHWLKKSTTLEDIYRHYGINNKIDENVDNEDDINIETPREDFDTDITGYAVASSKVPQNMPKVGGYGGGQSGYGGGYSTTGGANNYAGHYGSSAHGQEYQHYSTPQFIHYHHDGGKKKEMILKDLFDIALTALAFLSFGIFAIQVILCIAASRTVTTTTTTAPAFLSMVDGTTGTGTDTGTGTGTGADTGSTIILNDVFRPGSSSSTYANNAGNGYGTRHRRQINEDTEINNKLINEVARRVLVSMEAIFIARQDNGNCLRHVICINNKFSRTLKNSQKIWIPVYGLALSWLSGRLSTNLLPAPAMLESLKASLLGLGNGDCDTIYSGCNLFQEREARRRK